MSFNSSLSSASFSSSTSLNKLHDSHASFNKWFYLLVLFAGASTVFAFSPFNFYPLAWVSPAVLFYLLTQARTRKQHFYIGWLYGIGVFGAGASWPFYSMYYYAYSPLLMAVGGAVLFFVIIALLSTALFGLLTYYYRDTPLLTRVLLFYPASWVLIEWFRGWFLTGFPWLYLGHSQIDTVFSGFAPIAGVLGVSWSSVLIAGAMVSFIIGNSAHRTIRTEHGNIRGHQAVVEERFGSSSRIFSALLIVLLAVSSYSLSNIRWTEPHGEPILASVLQGNILQEEKFKPEQLKPTLKLYTEMTYQSKNSDLIIWPETALPALFVHHMDSLILPLQDFAKKNKSTVMIGGFYENEARGVENSVLSLTADNREVYSKQHLVPFGEYIPFLKYLRWLDEWIQLPFDNVAKGADKDTLLITGKNGVGSYQAQMTVCYEDAFGEEIIESMPLADLLINVTNDGWFTGSLEPYQHMQIARMRSLETGRYMVRSTNTGPSGIIDEKGKLVATAPIYTTKVITHQVQPFTGSTPYARWGNWLIVSLLGVILLFGLILARKK